MMWRKTETPLVPKLRFAEFQNSVEWHIEALDQLATPISEKVGTAVCIPMSITTGVGLVSQIEKFGRNIAGDSYKNYIRLEHDDFAYNKSATKEFPQGYIAQFSGTEDAAVPNSIFTCFRPNRKFVVPEFLDHLFHGNHHGRWLRKFITVGARAHGSLSVNDDDLFAMPIPLPPTRDEQQKIAECLGSLDDLIAAESRKLDALRQHKKGLMQQLFPRPERIENGKMIPAETAPCLRFPEFQDAGEWKVEVIDDFAETTTGSRDTQNKVDNGQYPFFVRSQTVEGIDTFALDGEAVLTSGDGVGVGKNFHYINGKFDFHQRVYCIHRFRARVVARFFFYFFSENFGPRVKKVSAKNSVDSVRRAMITEMPVPLPSIEEQKAIAACLTAIDGVIDNQDWAIESLKQHKRGLLQQLFPSLEG